MSTAKRYRLSFPSPQPPIVVTATGAMGQDGTEVYVDDTGGLRVEIDDEGRIRTVTTTLVTGGPVAAAPLD